MIAGLVIAAALGLIAGAGWLVVRTGRAWRATVRECRAALGGELTPGNLLLPPRLWLRADDGLSLVVGLAGSGEGGNPRTTRIVGGARSLIASTRISVDGGRLPHDIRIYPSGALPDRSPSTTGRRVTLGIPALDKRMRIEGSVSSVLSRMGAERRSAVAAAVGQGASLDQGVWTIERPEPVMRSAELIGLSRLLLAAARALEPGDTIADERLCASVQRDPEPAFRLRCLDCLVTRPGLWRTRAIEAALADPAPEIRLRAAQAAGVGGRETLTALARGRFDDALRAAAITTLANDDGPEVRALLEALAQDGTRAVRAAALRAMRQVGHAPVELLERFCRHPEPTLRGLALQALRPAGSIERRAIDALEDPVPAVVRVAVDILAAQGSVSAIPALRSVRVGPLDGALRTAIERATGAISRRVPRAGVGQLSLAGPDQPEAGRLSLDDDQGGLSDEMPGGAAPDETDGPALISSAAPVADLFAEPDPSPSGLRSSPPDLFAAGPPGADPADAASTDTEPADALSSDRETG